MLRYPFCLGCLVAFAVALGGCSGADPSDDSTESQDDIRASDPERVKAAVDDLFHPAPETLVASLPSTMKGLVRWDMYVAPKGLTIRGVSATDKIKVVYVVGQKVDAKGQPKVLNLAFVRAPDFDLPANNAEAHLLLNGAIRNDIAISTPTTRPGSLSPLTVCTASKETNDTIANVLMSVTIVGGAASTWATFACGVGMLYTGGLSCLPLAFLALGASGVAGMYSGEFQACGGS